ncbi:MAG: DUF4838 domain-containing protein [Treponema sp.]|nr:DUF4838 domain-containing protein [Treponema sp.]
MANFNASLNWVILLGQDLPAVRKAAEDLGGCIKLLGGRNFHPAIIDADDPAVPDDEPVIILNNESGTPEDRNFSWRAADTRIEIFGQGSGGLCRGIYDFLSALGIRWPRREGSGQAEIAAIPADKIYPLKKSSGSTSRTPAETMPAVVLWKRLVLTENNVDLRQPKKRAAVMKWAIRSGFDTVVLPFRSPETFFDEAYSCGLVPETGGWVMSSLLPRKLFFFHKDFYRMEGGKRIKKTHFCPTNPDTISTIKTEARKIFRSAGKIRMFHIWPDRGAEKTWCSCPSCRAFSPVEQYSMAINSVADVLAEVNQQALISFYEEPGEDSGIILRKNIIRVNPKNIFLFSGNN